MLVDRFVSYVGLLELQGDRERCYVMLSNSASEPKIRVGYRACGILAANNIELNVFGKGRTPQKWVQFASRLVLGKNYPAHSGCCGIRGANHGNWCVDQFTQAGGAVVKISHNPPYIIQEVMHVGSEADMRNPEWAETARVQASGSGVAGEVATDSSSR